jgi:CheY-like chemotaxis protein
MTIQVLIADDHCSAAETASGPGPLPEVEVATGSAAIRGVILHRPAVVLMDLQMPQLNEIDAHANSPGPSPPRRSWS